MLRIKNEGVILKKTKREFENQAVLNPGCMEKDGVVHMYYRAVRRGNFSTIGYCQLKKNRVIERFTKPLLEPEFEFEKKGLEDPRIIELGGKFYLFYTAYDGLNARAAYAESTDLIHFEKKGCITPKITYDEAEDIFRGSGVMERYMMFETYIKQMMGKRVALWEKDAFLFSEKFSGRYALIHRILPGIQISYFRNFSELNESYWRRYLKNLDDHIILDPKYGFESRHIGSGVPPIKTEKGWLLIYHATEDRKHGKVYHAAAALLDAENPQKVLARLDHPLFSPEKRWEKNGDVDNVVFPTGATLHGDTLRIYYGAGDSVIATRSMRLSELLEELEESRRRSQHNHSHTV